MAKVSSKAVLEAIQSGSLGGFVKNNTVVAVSLELLLAIISRFLSLVWISIGQAAHLPPQDSKCGSIHYNYRGAIVLLGVHGMYNSGLK